MKSLELLPNKNYLLELEEEEMDWGYQYLDDIYNNLKKRFPESKFIIIMHDRRRDGDLISAVRKSSPVCLFLFFCKG